MTCVNEYCRRRRAHRFTRKDLHRIKHLPWVRADFTHVQTAHVFICSIRASCVVVLTAVVCGWWQDSLHQRVIIKKCWVHTLDGDIRTMAQKETAGKVLSVKTIQRQAIIFKKMVEIENQRCRSSFLMNVSVHLSVVCSFVPHSALQYLKSFQNSRGKLIDVSLLSSSSPEFLKRILFSLVLFLQPVWPVPQKNPLVHSLCFNSLCDFGRVALFSLSFTCLIY